MGSSGSEHRPLIGLTTYQEKAECLVWEAEFVLLHRTYVDMVVQAGGVPVLLPPVEGGTTEVVPMLDALVLTGGSDIDPARYGAEPHEKTRSRPFRDEAEVRLLHAALERDLPLLGVCRGAQLINVALGGTLYQDLEAEYPGAIKHDYYPIYGFEREHLAHEVTLAEGSRLHHAMERVRQRRARGVENGGVKQSGSA